MALSIEAMAAFCRKKGFAFPNSEIYGGMAGLYDYGPLGTALKNNIKAEWWQFHVNTREDVVGMDGCVLSHPKVWEASGHVANFADIMVSCTNCNERLRADTLVEDTLNIRADGLKAGELDKLIKDNKITCPKCKSELSNAAPFNMMFKTNVGPHTHAESIAYLRPETAQLIFANFKNVVDTTRVKLPFGIAQIGRAFRNEISPRNFLFRLREFEQMEIEFFINPDQLNDCPLLSEIQDYRLSIWSSDDQKANKEAREMSIKEAVDTNTIKNPWHAYWLGTEHKWFTDLGCKTSNLRIRQHVPDELSHYAEDTWDIEYNFPFGWKELEGMANRKDFDLKQHIQHSGKQLAVFDEEKKQHVVPHVVCEPSLGVDRAFLLFLFDAYDDDKERGNIVLRIHPKLAPIKVGVFPLVNKLDEKTRGVFRSLNAAMVCQFDKSGSIGRRYARADEIGIPYCVTVDFDTVENGSVTVRDRNTTKQVRIPLESLRDTLLKLLNSELEFEKSGELIA